MLISIFRALILYIVITFSIKFMGKRQISELQTSELVVALLISDIASIPMQNISQPLFSGLVPIVVLVCCEIFVSSFMMKSTKFRKLICGSAIIIIKEGKIQQGELRKLRMSIEDLYAQLREMDVFSIKDVAFAIIETNGKMSILKKSEKQPPDAATLCVKVPEAILDMVVINNSQINESSLSFCNLDKTWLAQTLKKENIDQNEIFIMTVNKNKEFNIIKKSN
ncbi:MAG: DUF421 domain-containing protein [Oscillospiraceae bacterium]|nr:DUF421 domain-containing protein [Oscillospiraceae bacterium]